LLTSLAILAVTTSSSGGELLSSDTSLRVPQDHEDENDAWHITPEGSLEKKHLVLDNILEDASFKLGPEGSPRYHAPETAHLGEQIADINKLAKEQGVLLPPLSSESNVIFAKNGIFAARIEGKAINLVNVRAVEGVSIELVGPSDPLPPNMVA
jgi:hypothetical protein